MRRLQPGRLVILLLCLLLGLFSLMEAAHGHAEPGGHCDLCLLTHAAALLPVLPGLALALRALHAARAARPTLSPYTRPRVHYIRPPPAAL